MDAGNILLLDDDDVTDAAARKMVGGRGAGKAGSDDDVFGASHRQSESSQRRENSFAGPVFLQDDRLGGTDFRRQNDFFIAVALGILHDRDEFFVELKDL